MYPVAIGSHRDRDQRSRNVVVGQSGGNAALPSLSYLEATLLMGRDLHGRYLLMLVTWLLNFPLAETYRCVEALSLLCSCTVFVAR